MLNLHEARITRSSHLIKAVILLFSALNSFDQKTWWTAYGKYQPNAGCVLVQDIGGSQDTATHAFPCNRKSILSAIDNCAQEWVYQSRIYKSG